jgi:hypothetical protein
MTAGHQRSPTDDGSGGSDSAGKRPSLVAVAWLDGLGFFLAVAFCMSDRFLSRSPHNSRAAQI